MSWGTKIGILYGSFVVMMVTLVVLCIRQTDISLVSEDYYKKEIAYQGEIDKNHNTSALTVPVNVVYSKESQKVSISFPTELNGSVGKVQFYRPSDVKLDFTVDLSLNAANLQEVSSDKLKKGLWIVKIEWKKDGKSYLKEQKIVI